MADDVFSNWPSGNMPGTRASNGGQQTPKPIPYSPPTADVPMRKGPGCGTTTIVHEEVP